ncbi:MAG: AAA family ATPase [Syntrophales bacterium]
MDYIYMDNFRGFEDTVIPLRQVNFLVGENSTGKTSVLALLHLLNNPDFWFRQEFNYEQFEFGGYSDIVSAGAQDKSEFRIGICRCPEEGKKDSPYCVLMHFREKEGLPSIYKFAMAEKDWVGAMVSDRNLVKYRIDKLDTVCTNRQDPGCFLRCVERYARDVSSGFKKVPSKMMSHLGMRNMWQVPEELKTLANDKSSGHSTGFSLPPFTYEIVALAPIRTKPKRTYDGYARPFSPEGEHTPHILRRVLTSRSRKAEGFRKILDDFGKASGLFQHVGIRRFGKEQPGPFEINITLGNQPLRINSVGYGVSQVLPVVVELIDRPRRTWFSIQQPEIHLHPRAQAELGEVLYDVALHGNNTLYVETHSDYLIDRFRYSLSKSKKKIPTQIMYFENLKGQNNITVIPIHESGKYPIDQPASFRSFFINESIRNLEI